ncbi:MAG: hypothetical protein UU16_C0040G0011 [Candidatus Woesebacteria bacterium GW2011_GWA2_40_7]|uniref:Uncharacterized protein n=2 Tax=Candidatus Woeseibacteriota TaxID=1752722 RepID=A0A0G0LIA8_9BACT|nr:MAG: hypothetical protein UT17_C0005G0026 [Candidatus Woesebacteria bacterium GW2011_GWB1_39_10]KKR72423.1 MAG: hypothetical protein UU16_C0040G0011 [Candidatus Woesebacteria bacterium GW2011_GWA2_40_7]
MKKSTKNKPRLLKFVFVILFVAGLFFAGLFYIRFSFNNGFSKLACDFKGYKWFNFGMGPTGCYQTYPDGGKACTSGDECVSNTCFTSGLNFGDEKRPMDNLVGKCPSIGPAYSENITLCGSAKIEKGKVVEDKRGCIY